MGEMSCLPRGTLLHGCSAFSVCWEGCLGTPGVSNVHKSAEGSWCPPSFPGLSLLQWVPPAGCRGFELRQHVIERSIKHPVFSSKYKSCT